MLLAVTPNGYIRFMDVVPYSLAERKLDQVEIFKTSAIFRELLNLAENCRMFFKCRFTGRAIPPTILGDSSYHQINMPFLPHFATRIPLIFVNDFSRRHGFWEHANRQIYLILMASVEAFNGVFKKNIGLFNARWDRRNMPKDGHMPHGTWDMAARYMNYLKSLTGAAHHFDCPIKSARHTQFLDENEDAMAEWLLDAPYPTMDVTLNGRCFTEAYLQFRKNVAERMLHHRAPYQIAELQAPKRTYMVDQHHCLPQDDIVNQVKKCIFNAFGEESSGDEAMEG